MQWKMSMLRIFGEQLDHFFNNSQCAAKVNLAFGNILTRIEGERFRNFIGHKNNTLLDRSKPVSVSSMDDLAKLKDSCNNTDLIYKCSRERMNTKWRFYKLTSCCSTHSATYGLQRRCFKKTSI